MKKSSIKEAVIAVTYKCNSHCRMCGIWKMTDYDEISAECYRNLPQNLTDINISGGEPFLRKDLPEIIKILRKKYPRASVVISSNGFATEIIASQMEEIIKINPEIGVAISTDAIGELHNDIRRTEGGFQKTQETLKKLKLLGVKKIKISFTMGDYNIDELKKVYRFAELIGAEFSLTLVHSSNNYFGRQNSISRIREASDALDWLIQKELSSWKIKKWFRAYYAHGMKFFIRTGKRILPDYSGEKSIFIDPKGFIYPSDVCDQVMGNLKNPIYAATDKISLPESWMICTARQAIKKHWLRVVIWILVNKLKHLV